LLHSSLYVTVIKSVLLTDRSQLYYHYLQDPLFHENAFALLAAINLFRAMYVMEISIRPRWRKKRNTNPTKEFSSRAEEEAADRRDNEIIKEMWCLVAVGLGIFLAGFGLWNLDNMYCSSIRHWRREMGLPWGLLLEGHGWCKIPSAPYSCCAFADLWKGISLQVLAATAISSGLSGYDIV